MKAMGSKYNIYENVDFYLFSSEKWYLDNFLQFTNTYTDVECGAFDLDIVIADYGRF